MPKVWGLQTKVKKINWHFYFDHRTKFTIKIQGESYKTGVGRQQNMEATKEVSKPSQSADPPYVISLGNLFHIYDPF